VSVELAQATRNGAPQDTKQRLEEIRQHCSEVASDKPGSSFAKSDSIGVAQKKAHKTLDLGNYQQLTVSSVRSKLLKTLNTHTLKRLASAVRFRPWPPLFDALISDGPRFAPYPLPFLNRSLSNSAAAEAVT
jgi:hypothetical protein